MELGRAIQTESGHISGNLEFAVRAMIEQLKSEPGGIQLNLYKGFFFVRSNDSAHARLFTNKYGVTVHSRSHGDLSVALGKRRAVYIF